MTDNNTNGFKLTMAEFKGKVLEPLDSIKEDIKEIKIKNSDHHKQLFDRMMKVEKEVTTPTVSTHPIQWVLWLFGYRK